MTPDEARKIVALPGPRAGTLDSMARELIEAPTLLALLSIGEPFEDAQRVAHERADLFKDRVLHLQHGEET